MISNEERRKVAANLREVAYIHKDALAIDSSAFCGFLGIGNNQPYVLRSAVLHLADMIDRPTCENVHDGREFECSECGMTWHLRDKESPCDEWAHVRNPRYCPNCGAEVIE